ncbi:Type I secretion system ABC transporter, PrtD family [Neorhizobium galegae bv. orientalis]|nr:Type I secretion system ABC transporter, PrtD family [Neorhizobium galegae bv. orientalis]
MFGSSKQVPSQPRAAAAAFNLKHSIAGIALVSGVINLLTLTSPLFMLQVYDRVLSSGSAPTLVGLAVLAAGLYAFQSLLDILRARVLLRIGERFDRQMSGSVHDAIVRLPLLTRMPGGGLQPLRDLDNVRGFLGGSGPTAFFDLPWMPLYLGICFLFHFWIGVTALIGAAILISLTLIGNVLSQKPIRDTITHNMARNGLMEAARRNAEIVQALGLGKRISLRWQRTNTEYLAANRRAGDVAGDLGGVSKSLRMVLQSAILAVGAYLVIEQEVTAGIMIASSIMMGRALAPVDLAISSWKPFLLGRQSWARIKILLAKLPEAPCVMSLPAPERELRLEGVTIIPPGEKRPTVANISFTVEAGSGLGIIGTSGSGKSTLSRVIVGAWLPGKSASTAPASISGTTSCLDVISATSRKASSCSTGRSPKTLHVSRTIRILPPLSRPPRRPAPTSLSFASSGAMRRRSVKAARRCRPANASASAWPVPFTAIPSSSSLMSRTPIWTQTAKPPSSGRSLRCVSEEVSPSSWPTAQAPSAPSIMSW